MKRYPRPWTVCTTRWSRPVSPTACRSCLIRVVRADSDTKSWPQTRLEQLGLGHHPITVLDQVGEHVEHLRLDVHELVPSAQLVAGGVEHRVPEAVPHGPILSLDALSRAGCRR